MKESFLSLFAASYLLPPTLHLLWGRGWSSPHFPLPLADFCGTPGACTRAPHVLRGGQGPAQTALPGGAWTRGAAGAQQRETGVESI